MLIMTATRDARESASEKPVGAPITLVVQGGAIPPKLVWYRSDTASNIVACVLRSH